MSNNALIIELSKQIALLQEENERLLAEKKQSEKKKIPPAGAGRGQKAFARWAAALYDERYSELCEKYRDDIKAIQNRFPRWQPKKFFDIEG